MPVDKNRREVPYLLGRMYAIIESSINEGGGQLSPNDYSVAMTTPLYAFPRLFARYKSPVSSHLREDVMMEMFDWLPSDFNFPTSMSNAQQADFFIGYEHELADIFREQTRRKVAKAVKLKRVERNMTQEQLANKAGITTQTVGNIESGKFNVSLDVLSSVMAVLGIKMAIE